MRALIVLPSVVALFCAGCASTPNVEVGYYLPRADLGLRATRTVGCDAQQRLYSATTVAPTVSFAADPAQRRTFNMRSLDGPLNDTDIGFTFREDGRLQGVNATTLGRGEEILKTAITLASAALASDTTADARAERLRRERTACAELARISDKPITLTYVFNERFAEDSQPVNAFELEGTNPSYADRINVFLDSICAERLSHTAPQAPIRVISDASAVRLHLREPARVGVKVRQGFGRQCTTGSVDLWSGTVLVPQLGTPYDALIPRAAIFGRQETVIALSEAGVITKLQYGHTSGTPGLLNAANAAATALEPDTAAERAAEARAQADLIAQQQRLIRCRTTPTTCT